jgi:hypothetical protein
VKPWVLKLQVINYATGRREQIKRRLDILEVTPPEFGVEGKCDRTRVAACSLHYTSPTQSGVLSLSRGNLLEFVCYDASVG